MPDKNSKNLTFHTPSDLLKHDETSTGALFSHVQPDQEIHATITKHILFWRSWATKIEKNIASGSSKNRSKNNTGNIVGKTPKWAPK